MITRTVTRGAALLLAVTVTAALGVTVATAHGYTENPTSRGRWCQKGEVRGCGDIQYEPQSTEAPKGFPEAGPRDGHICSADHERFDAVDGPVTPAGNPWPATTLHADEPVTLTWYLTARHPTTQWRWFLTKPGWNPHHALTRADLDLDNPLTIDYGGQLPPKLVEFTVNRLPDRDGRHVMVGVWDVHDTPNAFYSCADVYFA